MPLLVLIDSGSTHNFLSTNLAKKLNCPLQAVMSVKVTVANGADLHCTACCPGFTWKMQGHDFCADVYLIPLDNYDLILGTQWLATLGDIMWNFTKLQMSFMLQGQLCQLQGEKEGQLNTMDWKHMAKLLGRTQQLSSMQLLSTAELWSIQGSDSINLDTNLPPQQFQRLQELLTSYADVFSEPVGLPPVQTHDHRIDLKEGAGPVSCRPYRYAALQKDAIEKLISEMFEAGVIQNSKSPYASPVVLVKKDGTWCLCVHYRALNRVTIKDKFPIPIIEELLEELGGSTIFSKINLRFGYWQICMHPDDIHKTAFKIHQGHFEFLVLPFGLSNVPSTFSSLMNSIFRPYLRQFILVFFDDILIYSRTFDDHLQHLTIALQVLRDNQLFAKLRKCFFVQHNIEYLGHVISSQGVITDPKKIEAIMNWPQPATLKQLRGFLGLTGYYKRFVRNYGKIAKPLTDMLKKIAFQ